MKRVDIKKASGDIGWSAEMENPAEWIAEGTAQNWWGLPGEYSVEITDISAAIAQDAINQQAKEYLASTDWLIIREMDAGTPCPAEIKAERAAARARIVK